MYLLNYYPGIDTEIRDCRGFTALIKAAMTGRTDVVAALVMAGTYSKSRATVMIFTDDFNNSLCVVDTHLQFLLISLLLSFKKTILVLTNLPHRVFILYISIIIELMNWFE